jgi:hypothetical protein
LCFSPFIITSIYHSYLSCVQQKPGFLRGSRAPLRKVSQIEDENCFKFSTWQTKCLPSRMSRPGKFYFQLVCKIVRRFLLSTIANFKGLLIFLK